MKILFLDDCPYRTRKFISKIPSALTATTAKDFLELIKSNKEIDVCMLDHDLGGSVHQNSYEENCGMEVVRFIVKNKPNIKQIIVHSLNYPAAVEMVETLKDAGYNTLKIDFLSLFSSHHFYKICKNSQIES